MTSSSEDFAAIGQRWNERVRELPTSVTAEEAAEVLRDMHPQSVRDLAKEGKLPGRKIGAGQKASWRFNKIELVRLLKLDADFDALRRNDWHEAVAAMPDWLTTDQAAQLLRVRPTTVRSLAQRDEIPATRLPFGRSSWRFPKDALLTELGLLAEFGGPAS